MEDFGMDNFQLNFSGTEEFVGTNPFDNAEVIENPEEIQTN